MILDSNIIISYLNNDEKIVGAIELLKEENKNLLISSITFGEALSFPELNEQKIEEIKKFLNSFVSVFVDNTISEIAAFLKRKYKMELPDAIIAATALKYNMPLLTRDRHFKKIKEIDVLEI